LIIGKKEEEGVKAKEEEEDNVKTQAQIVPRSNSDFQMPEKGFVRSQRMGRSTKETNGIG
jgi:hypothetical protein